MRRQASRGRKPAGSSCVERLDPFSLPVRFTTGDAGADGRMRNIELQRERVIVQRCVRGIPMTLKLAVGDFLGVALRIIRKGKAAAVYVTLEHPDPGLSLPLYSASNTDNVVAEWQSWARTLRRPLLIADDSGRLHDLFPRVGEVRLGQISPRRRRRTAMKGRRPSMAWRRRRGLERKRVHRGEREIIARN